MNLSQNHLTELTVQSAIDPEVVSSRGYKTLTEKIELTTLGYSDKIALPALYLPSFDPHGFNGHCQIKPIKPIKDDNGKLIKYLSPKDQPSPIDYHPMQQQSWLQDMSKRLWIVEGLKKGDSHISKLRAVGAEEPVLSIIGIWGWGKDDKLNPAFNDIAITSREIVIVPDGDVWSNDNIKLACKRLKGHLGRKRAGKITVLALPQPEKSKKDGLDDFYAKGWTLDQILALLESQEIEAVQKLILKPEEEPKLSQIGALFVEKHPQFVFGLKDWRQRKNNYYAPIDAEVVDSELHRFMLEAEEAENLTYNTYNSNEVRSYAKNEKFVSPDKWDAHPNVIPMKNGFFELDSKELVPPPIYDEAYFSSGLDFDYDPEATCPNWENYLETLHRPDGEIEFLQEYIGYCLTTDTSHEIAVWLSGKRGAGKSTFVETIGKMLGSMAGSISLKEIAESRFGLYGLVGKRLAFSSENPAIYIKDIEIVNKIVSGETMRLEEKYVKSFDYRPHAKILFAMNKEPMVYQPENGFWRRVKIVKFDKAIEYKDTKLKDRLLNELPGIFNWAVTGYQRLKDRGRFTIPPSITSATDDFELQNDIVARFVAECCEKGEVIKRKKFYEAFRIWAAQQGNNVPSLQYVTDQLNEKGYEIKDRYQSGVFNMRGAIVGLQLDAQAYTEAVSLSDNERDKNYFDISGTDHSGDVICQ